ncbi:MAG: tRNA 2-thiouridine(34) synthase MnmA [Candidatus Aureabacteria bacterium]|nr:tRNA 2-thiouridine(34) synthase MnmA [Candidatus Auribacterota bacterium]
MKIVVGMSGGVDSACAALLLKEAGHEVVGVVLDLLPDARAGEEGIGAARAAAERIGIPLETIDARKRFQERVIERFREAYASGRTPNPCVVCNAEVKFATLIRRADEIGAAAVATGHYARIAHGPAGPLLLRGVDPARDQSYFLSRLARPLLRRLCFPLGGLLKDEVRRLAAKGGLDACVRPESREICFAAGGDYRLLLPAGRGEGDILDAAGRVVGRHPGIGHFTIGQRAGRYLRSGGRRYVLSIDPARNAITVGEAAELLTPGFAAHRLNWLAFDGPPGPFRALVKIRSAHAGAMGRLRPGPGGTAEVLFDEPQPAVTPGQAAVFYDGEIVLGGGWIEKMATE